MEKSQRPSPAQPPSLLGGERRGAGGSAPGYAKRDCPSRFIKLTGAGLKRLMIVVPITLARASPGKTTTSIPRRPGA